jgi:hypothetical protein
MYMLVLDVVHGRITFAQVLDHPPPRDRRADARRLETPR